ncbi:adenosine kinase [Acuticoccus sp.]|uniref:adenosine kinase n=1 Tax=Acuticoccus sp. TaxID=1904378 RepID=UPI003B51B39D
MTDTRYDVLGIGNAIFDILGHVEDDALARLGVAKGSMRLVDEAGARAVDAELADAVRVSGGSAGNTVAGVASLGGRAAFIGKVATDAYGEAYTHDMRHAGVAFETPPLANGAPTATSTILVTSDGERTMNTFLGASQALGPDDVDGALVEASAITFLEGYLFDPPHAKAAFRRAAELAAAAGRTTALTLSDTFCVERHRADFLDFLSSGTIHLAFANAAEARALAETDDLDAACERLAGLVPMAVVTMGEHGARVLAGAERIDVPAVPTRVVDLTGAGDLFAAGFLLGRARGAAPEPSARLGAFAAAEVISHFGARPQTRLEALAREAGLP